MVDLDNLVTIANSGKYPNLFNSSDVDNIRGIVDVYSDIASNNFDNGCAISNSTKKGNRYGFRYEIPTGISQYQFFDGSIADNKVFSYLKGFKAVYFQNSVFDFEIVDFEPIPLFSATIDAICELATEVTGNSDTTSLRGLLDVLENITSEEHDYEITSMIFSKINQSIRIGLDKKSTVSVSDELFKYIGTRSNTKVYQNIQGLTYSLDDILDDWEKNSVQMYIEFNSTGLVKSLGYGIYPRWKKDAVHGTTAHDNFATYTERNQSHKDSVVTITSESKTRSWLSTEWVDEISNWENEPKAIFAALVVTADAEGISSELTYGVQTQIDKGLY